MLPDEFDKEYRSCRVMIDEQLQQYFKDEPDGALKEAMRYSLLAGGKRIRPILALQFCKASGGDVKKALAAACAVEMLHTYSLIHDDLPCMDDDDLRRGKPTNHKMFGECIATLAGDALQAAAFETLSRSELSADYVVKMVQILSKAAGLSGICHGQALDMQGEEKNLTISELMMIHQYKTSALLIAAAQLGVAAAGGSNNRLRAAEEYAHHLGLAFQVQDDILDVVGTTEELGKPTGSDKANNKTTFLTLMSLHDARHIVSDQTHYAIASLHNNFANTEFLEALAINLEERKY